MTNPIHLCRFFAFLAAALLGAGASVADANSTPLIAGAEHVAGQAIEGGLIVARARDARRVSLDGEALPVSARGYFLIGFHRDSDRPATLEIRDAHGLVHRTTLRAAQRQYNIQRIDGLDADLVTPPQSVIARIQADSALVRAARARRDAGPQAGDFMRGLDMPVSGGRITGVYGSQRILNGEARAPHYGIDIAASRGTPVRAPAAGRVTLVHDLYFSGLTVFLSHGLGLNSAFLHLEESDLVQGQEVARGQIIGRVGSSGRSTGPHLDWRLDWQGRRLDAALVRDLLDAQGDGAIGTELDSARTSQ